MVALTTSLHFPKCHSEAVAYQRGARSCEPSVDDREPGDRRFLVKFFSHTTQLLEVRNILCG